MEIKQVNKAEILQKAVNNYTRMGYRVTSQTSDTAQLIKPKKFSCLLAVILLLLIILPLIIYIFMYMAQKDETVYLRVDDLGALYITDEHELYKN